MLLIIKHIEIGQQKASNRKTKGGIWKRKEGYLANAKGHICRRRTIPIFACLRSTSAKKFRIGKKRSKFLCYALYFLYLCPQKTRIITKS